ncbi:MAG: hypothetical protein KDB01_00350 [Planctomycetaceae bacterium]|nr:hypothetical protein [Planctomycetaceae bacterium]
MEAPACGFGRYTRDQIEFVLSTALTGFRAAVLESRKQRGEDVKTAIHTGYWGCGAYGGNRVLIRMPTEVCRLWMMALGTTEKAQPKYCRLLDPSRAGIHE